MHPRLLALAMACACAGVPVADLDKFQVLVPAARVSGTVVFVSGTDFDLKIDQPGLSAPWPYVNGIVHCEVYGYGPYPAEEPGAYLAVGERVSVAGVLVLDNTVHPGEEAGRVVMRGAFKAWRPKLELHPYWMSSIVRDPPPLATHSVEVGFWAEVYAGTWTLDEALGIDNVGVPGTWSTATMEVGNP